MHQIFNHNMLLRNTTTNQEMSRQILIYQFDSWVYRVKKCDWRRNELTDGAGSCTGNQPQNFIGG